jgi:hypothetical protein
MGVWAMERRSGAALPFLYPLIDAAAVAALLWRFPTPGGRWRDLALWIVALLLAQQLMRLGLTPRGLHWSISFVLNRMFEVILLSIWAMALMRIFQSRFPRAWAQLTGRPAPRPEKTAQRTVGPGKESRDPMPVWLHNLLAEIHNDGRPEAEHIPRAEKPARAEDVKKARRATD